VQQGYRRGIQNCTQVLDLHKKAAQTFVGVEASVAAGDSARTRPALGTAVEAAAVVGVVVAFVVAVRKPAKRLLFWLRFVLPVLEF